MSVRIPSIGEVASTTGVPLAGTLREAVPTGPGVVDGVGEQATAAMRQREARTGDRRAPGQPHRDRDPRAGAHPGPRPVPLLPGLTAGSPAAQRGQVAAPGS